MSTTRAVKEIRHFYELTQDSCAIVQAQAGDRFNASLETSEHDFLTKMRALTQGLQHESGFAWTELGTDWSIGQTEGQITRLKFIKRQIYGRASFELLRQKIFYQPDPT